MFPIVSTMSATCDQQREELYQAFQKLSAPQQLRPSIDSQFSRESSMQLCQPAMYSLYNTSIHFLATDLSVPREEYMPYSPYALSSFSSSASSLVSSSRSSSSSSSVISTDIETPLPSPKQSLPPKRCRIPGFTRKKQKDPSIDAESTEKHRLILDLDSKDRDIYGFKRPLQWVKASELEAFDQTYAHILDKQANKWDKFLAEYDGKWPPVCSKLKRYVRKGIPRELRGKAWMHYSGAKTKMDANPGMYESLASKAADMGKDNEYAEVVYRDLHRTFPDNFYFSCAVPQPDGSCHMVPDSNPKLCALQRVLLAFSVHSPHIGYCQSLNFLAGFFLLFLDSEEEAFWMLETVVNDYYPEHMFDSTMEGATVDQTVLMQLVYEKMPGVWNKFSDKRCFWECEQTDNLPPITLVTSHWFLTLFINILPVETVLRVWDCVFIEGYKVLFRVALTIIKLNDRKIKAVEDPTEVFQILQNMPRRLIDCHKFMECVFSKPGVSDDLTLQDIEARRTMFRDRRRHRRPGAIFRNELAAISQQCAADSDCEYDDDDSDKNDADCTAYM